MFHRLVGGRGQRALSAALRRLTLLFGVQRSNFPGLRALRVRFIDVTCRLASASDSSVGRDGVTVSVCFQRYGAIMFDRVQFLSRTVSRAGYLCLTCSGAQYYFYLGLGTDRE